MQCPAKLPIEGIGNAVYTLNGRTILTRNALHIPALRGPLYSLRKHRQRPGFGVYSSYKDGSYLFLPDFILQVEDSYENLVSYQSLGASYEGPINYIEPNPQVTRLWYHLQSDHLQLPLSQHNNHHTSYHHMMSP